MTVPSFDFCPVTFGGYMTDQARNWPELFPAERDYFLRLAALLKQAPESFFAPLQAIEQKMGVTPQNWPRGQFTLAQVDFLNRNAHYAEWRREIARLFSILDPQLDEQVRARGHRRAIVVTSPADMPVGTDRMWLRIREQGRMVALDTPEDPAQSTALLLGSLLDQCAERYGEYSSWCVETGEAMAATAKHPQTVRLSYARLLKYRSRLMEEVRKITETEKIQGPRQLGQRLKGLKAVAGESEFAHDPALGEFLRATLLSGNGTLLVNNTFVEWASVQAIRRARPTLLTVGFGIRNKMKPFSSLLIYADQETSNPIPTQADMLGSYVDLEILYQYIWREPRKYVDYENRTAMVYVAEGMDEALVIAPAEFRVPAGRVALPALQKALQEWLLG